MTDDAGRGVDASESAALRTALAAFATRRAWLRSPGGGELAARVAALLAPVRLLPAPLGGERGEREEREDHGDPTDRGGAPRAFQAVHWNLLHGIAFDAILQAFESDPRLAAADLVSLNEADWGLARSGNRPVAFDLARRRGLHAAWAAQFLELEGGYRTPRAVARAPQGESLFGLALLSRWPLANVRRVELPSPEGLLFDRERKAGRFVALVAQVQHPVQPFTACVTHLDVHGSPRRRAAQMQVLLAALPPGKAVILGDFNTTTFARGSALRSGHTLATLAFAPRRTLRPRLLAPHRPAASPPEPLFEVLRGAGFAIDPFNNESPTLHVHFHDVHELDRFPGPLRALLLRALRGVERRNAMRLDWIVARGFDPAPEPPFALAYFLDRTPPPSDHAPVGCTLRF